MSEPFRKIPCDSDAVVSAAVVPTEEVSLTGEESPLFFSAHPIPRNTSPITIIARTA